MCGKISAKISIPKTFLETVGSQVSDTFSTSQTTLRIVSNRAFSYTVKTGLLPNNVLLFFAVSFL